MRSNNDDKDENGDQETATMGEDGKRQKYNDENKKDGKIMMMLRRGEENDSDNQKENRKNYDNVISEVRR